MGHHAFTLVQAADACDSAPPLFMLGRFQHYKGGHYALLCVARCEGSPGESLAVYMHEDTCEIWARPVSEFGGMVETESGATVPRFTKVTA